MSVRALLATCVLGLAGPASAGVIFLPGTLSGDAFTPDKAVEGAGYSVLYSTSRVELSAKTAVVRTEETMAGPAAGARFVGVLPLPEGTAEDAVLVQIDGAPVKARFLDRAAAQTLYANLAKAMDTTRLVAFADRPALLLPRVELRRRTRITVQQTLPVTERGGLFDARIPLPAAAFGAEPVRRITVEVKLTAEQPLRAVFSPTHDLEVRRPDARTALLRVSAEDVRETPELRVLFVADADPLGLRVVTHRPEGAEHGWFMVLGNPTDASAGKPAPKDVALALDTSGSMRGEKLAQAQLAAEYVIDHLGPEDRFNIIAFGSDVAGVESDWLAATPENRARARTFVRHLVARGRTNISGALESALFGSAEAGRPRMVLFLTDGAPTAGEMNPDAILEAVKKMELAGTRIFALGVGHDVNAHLLDGLALATDGRSMYVGPDEEIDVKVAALYDGLSHPLLTDVALDFGGLKVEHVYPDKLGALFRGQEVLLSGRYSGGGAHTVTLSGQLRGEKAAYRVTADFPKASHPDDAFVAWLWASRRVGDLLRQIRLEGQTQERIAEVVQLSQQFGILTEYTAFLAEAGRVYSPEEANAEAGRLMGLANMNSSGRWAVQQAGNEIQLRQKKVSSAAFNTYRDRQGTVRATAKMKTVGGSTFYQRDGKWVQSGGRATKKRRVKKYSREYFDLVNKNKDFARAQALDGDTEMDLGDERVETY